MTDESLNSDADTVIVTVAAPATASDETNATETTDTPDGSVDNPTETISPTPQTDSDEPATPVDPVTATPERTDDQTRTSSTPSADREGELTQAMPGEDTPTPVPSPMTGTAETEGQSTTTTSGPGFGVLVTLFALLEAGKLLGRRES